MIKTLRLSLLACMFAIQGCAPSPNTDAKIAAMPQPSKPMDPSVVTAEYIEQRTWILTQLDGHTYSDKPANFRFENGRMHGFDGCNYVNSTYQAETKVSTGSLKFPINRMASTMMACIDGKDVVSKGLRDAMNEVDAFQVTKNILTWLSKDKKVLAKFAVQDNSLANTKWRLNGLNNGYMGVAHQDSISKMTLSFLANGQFEAQTPCGILTGSFNADTAKGSVRFANIVNSGSICSWQSSNYKEHQQLVNALDKATTYKRTADSIEFRAADGATQLNAQVLK